MSDFSLKDLYRWCSIPYTQLATHPERKVPLRIVSDATELAQVMARTLVDEIHMHNQRQEPTRAIIPCGPTG